MFKGVDKMLNHFQVIVMDCVFSLIIKIAGTVEIKNAVLIAVFVIW